MNNTDLKTIFKNYLVLLEAHNEQKRHISEYFKQKSIRVLEYPFFTADYSFMIMPNNIIKNDETLYFGKKFLIERKSGAKEAGGGFAEIRNNLTDTTNHKCFKAEFQRMSEVETVILLIENASCVEDISKVKERKLSKLTYAKIFNGFIANRNKERKTDIKIVYTPIEKSGETVMLLIFNYLKIIF